MTRRSVPLALIGLLLLVGGLSGCEWSGKATPRLREVTLQLQWTHQAQFGGFYVADRRGYYAEEGLAVKFLEGGPGVDSTKPVLEGRAQFGDRGADLLLLARAAGRPVRAVATIYRRSPIVFFAATDSGIRRPQDFAGRRVNVAPEVRATLHAMTERVGIRPDRYTEVTLPSDLSLFVAGKADVWGAYSNGFALTVQRAGHRVNLIYPDDYGVHFYADTLFTTDELIGKDPDLVRRFLRATLRGWTYAVEHAGEVGPLVRQYSPKADAELETAKMVASLPLVNTGEDRIGWIRPGIWAGMERTLRDQRVLTGPLDVTAAYTGRFLDEIYGSDR